MDTPLILSGTILLLIVILFLLVSVNKKKIDKDKKGKILKEVYSLKKRVSSEELAVRRDTIIKLDNLLSKSLQLYYKNDSSCGENLKTASTLFKKRAYNSLWDTHKLRNKIVHDDYDVSKQEALRAHDVYKNSIIRILK